MKTDQMYKTHDGKIFETEKEAEAHEISLQLQKEISHIVNEDCYSGMGASEVVDFILDNKMELFSALSKVCE